MTGKRNQISRKSYFALICLFLFITFLNTNAESFNGTCKDAKLDINKFFDASVGKILEISKTKMSSASQNQQLESLIESCADVTKIAKRVLGKAKWEELSQAGKDNFLHQYPLYFVQIFRSAVIAVASDAKGFKFAPGGVKNLYNVSLMPVDSSKNPVEFSVRVEEKDGQLFITDGQFANVSIINSQAQMFSRLYDEQGIKAIENFNAKTFLSSNNK